MLVFGLSTESQIMLAAMAGLFIIFSLLSSFVFPARNPDFPGKKWRNLYIVVCIAFFLAMMGTVLAWGKEAEEEVHEEGGVPAETVDSETAPSLPAEYANGDAAAGEVVFTANGCGACHVMKAANATGTIGPDLDAVKPDEALIADRVVHGKGAMPPFGDKLSDQQVADVVAYVHESTQAE